MATELWPQRVGRTIVVNGKSGADWTVSCWWVDKIEKIDAGRPCQLGCRTNIRWRFQLSVTKLHSPRAFWSPSNLNCRKPITDLMIPKAGSGVCLRNP